MRLSDFTAKFPPRHGTETVIHSTKNCFKLPETLWETVSAFANTDGGMIVLGASEKGGDLQFEFRDLKTAKLYHREFCAECKYKAVMEPAFIREIEAIIVVETYKSECYQSSTYAIMIQIPKALPEQKPVFIPENVFTNTYLRRDGQNCLCSKNEVRQMLIEAVDAELGTDAQEAGEAKQAAEPQGSEKQAEKGTEGNGAAEAAEGLPEELNGKLADVYSYVKAHPHATSGDIADVIQLSRESAKKYLQRLSALGLIAAEGANKNRRYVVK